MQDFADPTTPRYTLPFAQLPRGFVPFPDRIREHLEAEQERKGFRFADDYARDSLERQTLCYYYDGYDVAFRSVDGGVEVLGVGWEEAWPHRGEAGVKVVQA